MVWIAGVRCWCRRVLAFVWCLIAILYALAGEFNLVMLWFVCLYRCLVTCCVYLFVWFGCIVLNFARWLAFPLTGVFTSLFVVVLVVWILHLVLLNCLLLVPLMVCLLVFGVEFLWLLIVLVVSSFNVYLFVLCSGFCFLLVLCYSFIWFSFMLFT